MVRSPKKPRAVMREMLNAAWVCQAISVATRLNVPDLLQQHGPLTALELTGHGVAAPPDLIERVLRTCASAGVFTEDADGRFGATPLSATLTADAPKSAKRFAEMFSQQWWSTWGRLYDAVTSGEPQGRERWDYANDHEGMVRFAESMRARRGKHITGLLEHFDFSRARTLVDIGGSLGHIAIAILEQHPHLRATVLDLPELARLAGQRAASEHPDLLSRLSFAGGDMFADVPPGDTYVLSRIIHDWDDASALHVLQHCRARMDGDGRVLCVDAVLPPLGDTSALPAHLMDINMLVGISGKERTEQEWRALLEAAGLQLTSMTLIEKRSRVSVLEASKRP